MVTKDPGHGGPEHWTPVDVAAALGCSLSEAEEAYATMSDDEWFFYCLDIYMVQEQQRRDEKHGLYGEHDDIAN